MIKYLSGYKYQLAEDYALRVPLLPKKEVLHKYIELYMSGLLVIREGYAWDGPSGPAIDTRNFMRGSLVHDALYQLLRDGCTAFERKDADQVLKTLCLEDGMSRLRAEWVYMGVRGFGGLWQSAPRKVETAP